jgi:O-antigen/teichoic acid export membrane protein
VSSLKPKFLYQLAVTFLYSAAPIIVFPYISRVLGPENIGKINFIDYTAQFFILFATFGIPLYGAREIAKVRDQKEKLKQLTSELVSIHLWISILSVVAFISFAFLRSNAFNEKQLLFLAGFNILINAFSLDWLLQGLEDFAFFSKRSYVSKLLSVALIFLVVKTANDYVVYYLVLIASNALIIATDLLYAAKKKIGISFSVNSLKHLKPLTIFFLTTATMSLYTYFDTIILGIISGSLAVGFYTTGLKTIKLTQNFVNDLGGVLMPRMSYLIQTNQRSEIERIIAKSLLYVLTISIPLGLFFYLMAPEIILVLAGKQFLSSVIIVQLLSVLPLIIGLSNVFGIQVLLPFGKENNVLLAVVTGSVLSIGLNVLLCPLYAEKGAAISCIVAEAAVTALMGILATKQIHFNLSFRAIATIILSSLLFIPIVWFLQQAFDNAIWKLIVGGLLCAMVYLGTQLVLFSNAVLKEMINFFWLKIFKRNVFAI